MQDLPNPEVYLGVARLPDGSVVTTKYSDGLQYSALGESVGGGVVRYEQLALWDRRPAVVAAPPLTAWAAAQLQGQQQQQRSVTAGTAELSAVDSSAACGPAAAAAAAAATAAATAAPVVVYLYDRQGCDLMLHDLVDVVGVLCRDEPGQVSRRFRAAAREQEGGREGLSLGGKLGSGSGGSAVRQ